MTFPMSHPALQRALAARGYTEPTAVQNAVLAEGAGERDLLVSAQTGSGKTVAFGLAIGRTLLGDAERLPQPQAPLALVIAPTRELALQVCRELTWLYAETGARVIACVGGMDVRTEARALAAGAHIVVGTPGRLRDHVERGRLDLSALKALVLDEADEMLDLGFRDDLEFLIEKTPPERRSLMFSATLPREIETLAARFQRDALRIETRARDVPHADIEYVAHRVAPQDIENAVVNILRFHEARAALVFCATREAVNRLSARLGERSFQAVALSGELTQQERTRALQAVRDGRARVLVATDVAARGLDLPDLALVVHAELPNDAETLLHRSGRTGRAGRKGLCVLVVPFNRRRRADILIRAGKLDVTWKPAPTPDEIRARDNERFLADASFTTPAAEDETEQTAAVQAAHTPDAIALALVRLQRAQLPAPEDLTPDSGPPPRRDPRRWEERSHRGSGERDSRYRGGAPRTGDGDMAPRERTPRPRRQDDRDFVWFNIDIGRERNAEPRWLLPLLCRAGGVTKNEIGAIRIDDRASRFQVLAEAADRFADAAASTPKNEARITRAGNSGESESAAHETATAAPQHEAPHHADRPARDTHTARGHQSREGREGRDHRRPAARPGRESHGTKPWERKRHSGERDTRRFAADGPAEGATEPQERASRDAARTERAHQAPHAAKPWHKDRDRKHDGGERWTPGAKHAGKGGKPKKPFHRGQGPGKAHGESGASHAAAASAGPGKPSKYASKKKARSAPSHRDS